MNAQLDPNTVASNTNIRSVYLDSTAEIFKCSNQICPVIIKMSEYSVKRRDAIEWYSDPFYTHNKGYKMCLKVYSAGTGVGKGTHLSVFLYLMKGPHDDELAWPLKGRFQIKLLSQICDDQHHSETATYNDNTPDGYASRATSYRSRSGWGFNQFIKNEYNLTPPCQFLKDDSLFFRVTNLNFNA